MKNRIIKIIILVTFIIILTSCSELSNKGQKRFFVGTDLHYIIMPIGATTFIEASVFEKTSLYNNEEVDFSADNLTWKTDNKDIVKMSNSTGNKILIEAEKIGKTYITVSYPKCMPGEIYVECMSAEDYKNSDPYLRCNLLYIPEKEDKKTREIENFISELEHLNGSVDVLIKQLKEIVK